MLSPKANIVATEVATPQELRALEGMIVEGAISSHRKLTAMQKQALDEAVFALHAQLISPKKQEVASRIAKRVVSVMIDSTMDTTPHPEQAKVKLIKTSSSISAILSPMVKGSSPTKDLFSRLPGRGIEGFPLMDRMHVATDGCHWLPPGKGVPFIKGPFVNPETGVFAGVHQLNSKFSSFFPLGRFTTLDALKTFVCDGTKIAAFNNRYLMQHEGLIYEVYMERHSKLVISTVFPIFQFLELKNDDSLYALMPETGIEYSYKEMQDLLWMSINDPIECAPLRFTLPNNGGYVFDLAPCHTKGMGLNSGIYLKISEGELKKLIARNNNLVFEKVVQDLVKRSRK